MKLIDLFEAKERIISIVGMAKNAGKTVTLNHLIESFDENGFRVGITSIGRDGERTDIVTKTDKPMIFVKKGTLVATAEMLFNLSESKMEILEVTDYQTAMGRVIIGKALTEGFVQVGGPTTNSEVRMICEKMCAIGADYVLVDGALDRTSSASPAITDACILSTGAVISRDMYKTVDLTAYKASMFSLESIVDPMILSAWEIAEASKQPVLVESDGTVVPLSEVVTAIGSGKLIADQITEDTVAVLIPGALVTQTVKDVISVNKNLQWVIADATRLFIDYKDWLYFKRVGLKINVRYGMQLKAVTANPYSPQGYYYDSESFVSELQSKIVGIPVYDVMA